MASKYVVTGAAGFVGSTLAERLIDDGAEVVGVDCLTDFYSLRIKKTNLERLLGSDRFTFIEKNILDVDWQPLLDGATTVFHQAAQAGVRDSWGTNFKVYTDLNVLSTQVLLEQMKGTGVRMVYASSSSIYGDTDRLPMKEDDEPRPYSPYGVTKLAAEHLCRLYWRNFSVPTVSLRYFTVFGARQRPDMAFHRFIRATLNKEPIHIFGDGEQTRDFTCVDDIVDANLLASESGIPGAIYNIGGGNRITVNDALKVLERVLNSPIQVLRSAVQKGDVRHTFADTTLAREQLSFNPSTTLEKGLACEARWIESLLPLSV